MQMRTSYPMKPILAVLSALILLSAGQLIGREGPPRSEQSFDAGWLFHRGDSPGAENAALTTPPGARSTCRMIGASRICRPTCPGGSGRFSPDSPGGASTGYVLGGTGWYRKHFALGAADAGRLVSVLFDGVYMDADVWLNGRHLGNHPYGYTAFAFDLTSTLRPAGQTNVLAVRVRNLGKNSRWYQRVGHLSACVADGHRPAARCALGRWR